MMLYLSILHGFYLDMNARLTGGLNAGILALSSAYRRGCGRRDSDM
jgi:hypothetical protein